MNRRIGIPALEIALLAAFAATPWMQDAVALPVGLGALALWLRGTDAPRERRVVGALLAAAWLTLGIATVVHRAAERASPPTADELESGFDAWLEALRSDVDRRAAEWRSDARGPRAFSALEEMLGARAQDDRRTYLVLDPDREAVAWAGRGLLHDLDADRLPGSGFAVRQSATSATVLSVAPCGPGGEGLFVVGESWSRSGSAPIAGELGDRLERGEWYLAGADGETPELRWLELPRVGEPLARERGRRIAGVLIALALLTLASLRAAGRALLSGTVLPRRDPTAVVLVLGGSALPVAALALGASFAALAVLVLGSALALTGWAVGERTASAGRGRLLLAAAAGPALAWCARELAPRFEDLSSSLIGDASQVAVRLGLLGGALGMLAAGTCSWRPRGVELAAWVAAALAGGAGAAANRPMPALALVALAGVAASLALRGTDLRRLQSIAAASLLAALLAGAAWTIGEREARRTALGPVAKAMAPPSSGERSALAAEIDAALARIDPASRGPADLRLTEQGDRAFAVWRRSPLARLDALSALVVEEAGGLRSSFSYGLPLDPENGLDPSPSRWVDVTPTSWLDARLDGEARFPDARGGELTVRWWLVPRFGFGSAEPVEDLAAGLLRGGALLRRPRGLPVEYRWAAWDGAGGVRSSSWEQGTPDAEAASRAAEAGTEISTPEGPARVASRPTQSGSVAIFLPPLGVAAALEKAGAVAAGGLLALTLLAAVALSGALPRSAVRDSARRALRSYSKRLLIVYAALLLIPVTLLYAFLSRTLERRLEREQEESARAALSSVQRVLGEYVLTLEPGFGIGTAIDDPLLELLSRVAQREVHLYWGGEIYASSKRDLFAAGLLPRRLPGEIRGRLARGGEALARRTSRAGRAEFLELYAPLEVPGEPRGETRLILSMPLLAQQEEALAEAAGLRRRALLVTVGLFLLLAATGTRLARRFTRPIEQIVAGTRRIAAGEDRLGFRPEEAELEALAEAIDRMASSIAQGRTRLLAEKRLVDRIVESVAAGVVALDAAGRALILNRAAREMLELEPGDDLAARIETRAELSPLGTLLGSRAGSPERAALRIETPEGEREWTAILVALPGAGDADALLVVEDVTEVARAQRLEAWAAMARIIAHEIKNPLTPIRLSAEHLREAWARDREHFEQVFERCTSNILRQVEELREIASEFSIFSRIPRLEKREGDLAATVSELVEAYRMAPPSGVEIEFEATPARIPARFDPKLLRRAVRNLVENSVRASAEGGRVEVRVEADGSRARIRVADRGPGVPPELLSRILEPYFSTHASGTGLGLPIAFRIAEEHGGSLEAGNRASGGFEVIVTIPLT